MRKLYNCPLCQHNVIKPTLTCTDHLVSGESFELHECARCHFVFTNPQPSREALPKYYESKDYISHTNARWGVMNGLYRMVRRLMMRQKREIIEKATGKTTGTLLDYGAGTGHFAAYMKRKGWEVTGLEPSEHARAEALRAHKLELLPTTSLAKLPQKSFDVLTMWHVLEHIQNVHDELHALRRLLRKDGWAFIAVPNIQSLDAKHYGKHWAAYDVPRHLYHFSMETAGLMLHKHHLQVEQVMPMVFDSFYVSLLSEKNKTGRTRWIPGLRNGFRTFWSLRKDGRNASSLIYIAKAV
jgi:2-polyprenyl-3-methyl-5-hydroxy-6-metoxy-1,4-benzoquinol methylase